MRLAVQGAACLLSSSALVLAQVPSPLIPEVPQAPLPTRALTQAADNTAEQATKKAEPGAPTRAAAELKVKSDAKTTRREKQAGFAAKQAPRERANAKRLKELEIQNFAPLVQQYEQQGRPMSRAEILFVRAVCRLSREQLKAVVTETETTLAEVAKVIAEDQQKRGMRGAAGATLPIPDAIGLLQERLAAAYKKHLTPDQQARYQQEIEKRASGRKQAGLLFLVDALDRELLLSAGQRDTLTDSLRANWDDSWCIYIDYILYGNQFFPRSIDRLVMPVLNETQKKAWSTTQKVQGFWGFGGVWNLQNDDGLLAELLGVELPHGRQRAFIGKAMMKQFVEEKQGARKP
jgi:hypothetical protein